MGTMVATTLPFGPTAGLNFQPLTASMAFSPKPRPGPLTTEMSMARPSGVIVTFKTTVPWYLALRASSEYCGIGQYKQIGTPTPFTPARNAPPPVPPPAPGPRPPPVPLPMPVPLPCPRDSEYALASGSPNVERFGLGTFKSGGPSSAGFIASCGFRFWIFTCGGVNCVHLNFGSFPLFTGVMVWSLAPPPPPAFCAPAGNFVTYGEISSGMTSTLPFACVGVEKCQNSGTKITSANTPA